ncbi:hypothetical protein Tco_0302750 [Tanacetum coccineum]
MRKTLADRLRMVYTRDEGQGYFTSHAWRILFETREPLVREFILKFLSTYRMSDTEMGLDVADTLMFSVGGVRRRDDLEAVIFGVGFTYRRGDGRGAEVDTMRGGAGIKT